MKARSMTVAGIMSGTSADGIDVAVVRIAPDKRRPNLRLLAHEGFPFPPDCAALYLPRWMRRRYQPPSWRG